MNRRTQIYLLSGLLVMLGWVVLRSWSNAPEIAIVLSDEKYKSLDVEDPKLRMDKLERIRKLEYAGTFRDIFRATPPPPPVKKPDAVAPVAPSGPQTPVETPLQLPFKFYGTVTDVRTGKRRAFFTDGEEIWIAAEGEKVQGRYTLLRIGNASADLEDPTSGKKATLPLDQAAAPQG